MTSEQDDRRHFSRINFSGEAIICQGNREWPVRLIDLSLKGLLIKEHNNFDIDKRQPVEVHIQLDDHTTITMKVQWRHNEGELIGFECKAIDIDSISHLRRLVELNLGNSQLLERELSSLSNT